MLILTHLTLTFDITISSLQMQTILYSYQTNRKIKQLLHIFSNLQATRNPGTTNLCTALQTKQETNNIKTLKSL